MHEARAASWKSHDRQLFIQGPVVCGTLEAHTPDLGVLGTESEAANTHQLRESMPMRAIACAERRARPRWRLPRGAAGWP